MSMDRTELKILRNTGTEKEKKYASKIAPVRDQGSVFKTWIGNWSQNHFSNKNRNGYNSTIILSSFAYSR
ncbi:uncharacterized protein Dsimw501_GD28306 [Drosophila simulans]|nr:uncharacterized protein Dsimw501_GD28306 [Drosophila simulans]